MRIIKCLLLLAPLFLVAGGKVWAEPVCFKCHAKDGFTDNVVHAPVEEGDCRKCHNPHVSKHEALLSGKSTELCYTCHTDLTTLAKEKKVVHKPFGEANCLACHTPHSSPRKGLLKQFESNLACFECHAEMKSKNKFEHAPFANGNCQLCHQPHAAEQIQLLNAEPDKLCFNCHKDGNITAAHRNFPRKVKDGGCVTCHNPHGSDRKFLIRNILHPPYEEGCADCHNESGTVSAEICLECHDQISEQIKSVHNHQMNRDGNGCINCHSPHASNFENMLRNTQEQVCRKCHFDTWQAYQDKPNRHPDSKVCSNCHGIHGSNHIALLKKDGNETCGVCHEGQGFFAHPVGAGVIDPRNGQNVTCVTCHYPHGTVYKRNLKLSGSMELCIQCHKNY